MTNSEILVCNDDYYGWYRNEEIYDYDNDGEFIIYTALDASNCENSNLESSYTWEQVFEWFREKGLVGTIEYEDFILDDKTCYYAYRITDKLGDILFYSPNYRTYETYEEAREALAIKLIEFYENNV